MAETRTTPIVRAAQDADIPPLENGDRLTRAEFERRYEAMGEGVKAELIGGIVYMGSPTKRRHGKPHYLATTWLGNYEASTPGTEGMTGPTNRLGEEDDPEPDLILRILAEAGGSSRIDEDDYLNGAPELIVEIGSSSASFDLHQKLETYRKHGVREYVVVVVRGREVRWHRLEGDAYALLAPDPDGILRSRVFPGLWLDSEALLAGDGARLLTVLARGIATEEHASFVRALAERMGRK